MSIHVPCIIRVLLGYINGFMLFLFLLFLLLLSFLLILLPPLLRPLLGSTPFKLKQSHKAEYPTRSLKMAIPPPSPAPQPSKPLPLSPEERRLYYHHFLAAGCLPLVARTSTFVWENPKKPGSIMYPIPLFYTGLKGETPFREAWADWQSGLMLRIMEAAEKVVYFNSIEPSTGYMNHGTHETLVISVNPTSLSWKRGISVTLR